MSKTYKGYELLKAIEEDEIKNGQKIKDSNGNIYIVVETVELLNDENGNPILDEMNLDTLLLMNFELIEDEIDIQSIKECKWMTATDRNIMINKLIKAVKQLDKNIKEKE